MEKSVKELQRLLASSVVLITLLAILGAPLHAAPLAQRDPLPTVEPGSVILPGRLERDRALERDRQRRVAGLDADPALAQLAAVGDRLVRTVVHLTIPSLASVAREMSAQERVAYAREIAARQDEVIAQIEAEGGQVLGRLNTLSSGVVALIPGSSAPRLARLPQVAHISAVHDYALSLSESVPAIGADTLHDLGLNGEGVIVAVIDSGVDYSHLAFGGPGTVEAWAEAYYGSPTCFSGVEEDCASRLPPDSLLFGPGAPKVIGGKDWVGEAWPLFSMSTQPDPNPIDRQGHGTHVADIIAGLGYDAGSNEDGSYAAKGPGVAPGAKLWALKACSAWNSSCNGVATILALDDAADLDDDPATYDPAHIVNLSLGSSYGQPEDQAVALINALVEYGVIVVVAAGNAGDIPYVLGQPSNAAGAISVAQTAMPSAGRFRLEVTQPPAHATFLTSGVWQPWSVHPAVSGARSGPLIYGNGDESNLLGCAAFGSDLSGRVVLLDRGGCDFTLKARHASTAGAILALIGMDDATPPFEGGDGGDRPIDLPVFMLAQGEAALLRAALADPLAEEVMIALDPAHFEPMPLTVVNTSSRGPRINDSVIKPEIGAPGASISARVGQGALTAAFGGTSGAAPMVAGAAALLKQQHGDTLAPYEYKALLMNNANPNVYEIDAQTGERGDLAPVTRVGSGQVDVAASHAAQLLAWDSTDVFNAPSRSGSLSFGYVAVTDSTLVTRTLTLENLRNTPVTVEFAPHFHRADDIDRGVEISVQPTSLVIAANGKGQVVVELRLHAGGIPGQFGPLKAWRLDKGSLGNDGKRFSDQEVDGHLLITPSLGAPIAVPWHVLPKAAAEMTLLANPSPSSVLGTITLLNNSPAISASTEIFDLVYQSANDFDYTVGDCSGLELPPGCNNSAVDLKNIGVRAFVDDDQWLVEFGLTLWDKPYRAAQWPVEFDIVVDSDRDGTEDYLIFNSDASLGVGPDDGRSRVFVVDLTTEETTSYFYTISDFNTQNTILRVPASALGLAPGTQFDFAVFAYEAYFTGDAWDCTPAQGSNCVGYHTYTLNQPAYALAEGSRSFETLPGASSVYSYSWTLSGAAASPSQIGLLFMHESAPPGRESDAVLLAPPAASLQLRKTPSTTLVSVGEVVSYTVQITNTGGMTFTEIVAWDDPLGEVSFATSTLAPAASVSAQVSYTVQASDLPGPLVNTVTVTGTPLVGDALQVTATAVVSVTPPPLPHASLAVSKRAALSQATVGEVVSYTLQITNTGEVTLSSIVAQDDKLGEISLATSTLAPAATTSAQATYTVQASDLPGPLVSTVTVSGAPPLGESVQASATATVTLTPPDSSLLLRKTVGIAGIEPECSEMVERTVPISTTVIYCYTVQNTGQQTLTHHTLLDSDLGMLLDHAPYTLAPGAHYSTTMTKTLMVGVTNVATWTAAAQGSDGATQEVERTVSATANISGPTQDQDGDGIPDNVEGADDMDGDHLPNFLDSDSDGDSILDAVEAGPDPTRPLDSNGDGVPDYLAVDAPVEGEEIFLPKLGR